MAEVATLPGPPADEERIARAAEAILALPVQRPEEARGGLFLRVGEIHASRRHYFLGLLAAADGRMDDARAQLDSLSSIPFYPDASTFRTRTLAGWLALIEGDPEGALEALGPPSYGYAGGLPGISSVESPRNRYTRAAALEASGRLQEALRWYESFPEPNGSDLPYLPAALLGRARVLLSFGRVDDARVAYAAYLAHRAAADAPIRDAAARIPELEEPGGR